MIKTLEKVHNKNDIEKKLEKRNIAFDAMFRLFDKLGTSLDPKKVVRLFLMTLMGQLRLRRVSLFLPTNRGQLLKAYHSFGIGTDKEIPELAMDCRFIRWVSKSRNFIHINEYLNIPQQEDAEDVHIKVMVDRGFSHALPLSDKDGIIGVIFCGEKAVNGGFTEFDIEMMTAISRVASITIRNAWSYKAAVLSKMEIENFSRVKKEFIDHTSHELRTPLTVIKSAIESFGPKDVEGVEALEIAKGALDRLHHKVEVMLTLNDIELKKDAFNMNRADVGRIMEDVLRVLSHKFSEDEITVTFNNKAGNHDLLVDSAKIKVLFKSLLDNAVTSIDRGGFVEIEMLVSGSPEQEISGVELTDSNTSEREDFLPSALIPECGPIRQNGAIGEELEKAGIGPHLVVRIKDNGMGIPEDEIACLSKPFMRASNSPLSDVKGLGLGLAISQRIVSGHGGRLFCRSEVGTGTEFSVWLPLDD